MAANILRLFYFFCKYMLRQGALKLQQAAKQWQANWYVTATIVVNKLPEWQAIVLA